MPDAIAEEAEAWSAEYHSFLRGRVARVQDQARAWLGVMTTMLSLFSLLVLVNKGQSLSDLPVPKAVRIGLFVGALLVYVVAFMALVEGARASFGGIGLGASGKQATPGGDANADPAGPGQGEGQRDDERLSIALRGRQLIGELNTAWNPQDLKLTWNGDWASYRDHQQRTANKLRRHLHKSRLLGIAASLLVGVLALVVLFLSAFWPAAPKPTAVIVVDGGQVTCGQIGVDAQGRTVVGGKVIAHATQIIAVSHC